MAFIIFTGSNNQLRIHIVLLRYDQLQQVLRLFLVDFCQKII